MKTMQFEVLGVLEYYTAADARDAAVFGLMPANRIDFLITAWRIELVRPTAICATMACCAGPLGAVKLALLPS